MKPERSFSWTERKAAPHMPVNMQEIDCDFFAFSGHKMLAPLGSAYLYGRKILEKMPPFLSGGGYDCRCDA